MNASNSHWQVLALVVSISAFLVVCCVVGLVLALTLARGQLRRLLTSAMAILLVVSVVLGVVMVRNATAPVAGAQPGASSTPVPFPSPVLPTSARPSPSTATPSPSTASPSPSQPSSKPSHAAPRPKPKPARWTLPKRGSRPGSPIFDQTWAKTDHPQLQQLEALTFAFSIPQGYRCAEDAAEVACGHGGFSKSDPYIVIYPGTCGCTSKQVSTRVDGLLHSKLAYDRLLPVARNTRASDLGNGQAKHQYWMVRLYGTGDGHGLDHEILVYAQANKESDDVKIRKIIGDIYDATR